MLAVFTDKQYTDVLTPNLTKCPCLLRLRWLGSVELVAFYSVGERLNYHVILVVDGFVLP